MISYSDAIGIIRKTVQPLSGHTFSALDSFGHILAADVISPENLPSFDNSAMDGAAFFTGGQVLKAGAEFDIAGLQAAGDGLVELPAQRRDTACLRIMTGARMPIGTDTVMPIEKLEILGQDQNGKPSRVRLKSDLSSMQNVRLCGQDIAKDEIVLQAGRRIDAAALAVMASLGIANIETKPKPKIGLVCTGNELVSDPSISLQAGQIRNSNTPLLSARLEQAGAVLIASETVKDDISVFRDFIHRMDQKKCDIVISCGAVSMGDFDFVPQALKQIGAEILFHKVLMRPGKPILFARLPNGSLYFGLPGNPTASAVGLRFFVEPAIRLLSGLKLEQAIKLPIAEDIRRKSPWLYFLKGKLALDNQGRLISKVLSGQESFKIKPLLDADCWIALPGDDHLIRSGSLVDVYPLGHAESLNFMCGE